MDTVRDLSRVEPWRESLERSLARRGKLTRSCTPDDRRASERHPQHKQLVQESPTARLLGQLAVAKRSRAGAVCAGAMFVLALLASTFTGVFGGRGAAASTDGTRAAAFRVPAASQPSYAEQAVLGIESGGARRTAACPLVVRSTGYVNPLAGARVTPERIDQGVDYAGAGTLGAVGAARVTDVATSETGWPGAFIEYRLLYGPDRGCYIYYAEGVSPAAGLRAGDTVRPGEAIATIIPGSSSGIEIGWGAGVSTKTYASRVGEWSTTNDADNIPSAAGKSFSALIAALGGPPGKVEG